MTISPLLNANPLQIARTQPTSLVPMDKIMLSEDFIEDPIFTSRYLAFLKGKASVHHTRISLRQIRRGMWNKKGNEFQLLGEIAKFEDTKRIKKMIRSGYRPALHLYENPNKDDGIRYVCSEDVEFHKAYEDLGVAVVPAVVMGKPVDMEESCISVRSFNRKPKEEIALIDGVVPVKHEKVRSFIGLKKLPLHEGLECLVQKLEIAKNNLRIFHQGSELKCAYHHSLHSVLLRAKENVEAILLLVKNGKILTATSLLRPLYELALTFYIDWLSPEHMNQYLKLASVMSEKKWQASCDEEMQNSIAQGVSALDAKNIRDANMRSYRLCSVVGEKARLFPLGEIHQRNIYSFLSDILHHDFSMDARYTHTLEHGDEAVYIQDASDSLLYIADILVASIVSRVQSDIGTTV